MQSAVPLNSAGDSVPALPQIPTTFMDVAGVRLHLSDIPAVGQESGAPLLWIHGLGGWLRNWAPNMPYFAERGYRCIAVDLPGFGDSEKPDVAYDRRFFRRTVVGLLDALGIDRATMIGNSMGGLISLELAQRRPERIDRLVLVDAAGVVNLRATAVRVALEVASAGVRGKFSFKRVMRSMRHVLVEDANPMIQAEMRMHFAKYEGLSAGDYRERQRALTRALWHIMRTNLRPWLPAITSPTLVVHGKQDKLVPFEAASIMSREIPGAQLAAYNGVGHVPQMEVPEKFNARLDEFLTETEVSVTQ